VNEHLIDRRRLLALGAGAALASLAGFARTAAAAPALLSAAKTHPDPRPGIDGSNVLAPERVAPHAAELFDQARGIPHILDGLRCACGCADLPDMRSLLSCYEGVGMAQYCDICSGEGRLAVRLHGEGSTLDEIRAAIDRRYG
jgi:hypothetical protein